MADTSSDNQFYQELQTAFLHEVSDLVSAVEHSFIALEEDPSLTREMEKILRLFHNLKGSAAAVGFTRLSEFSHKVENLLVKVKAGELALTSEMVDLLLKCSDRVLHTLNVLRDDLCAVVDYVDLESQLLTVLNGVTTAADDGKKKILEALPEIIVLADGNNAESLKKLVGAIEKLLAVFPEMPIEVVTDWLTAKGDLESVIRGSVAPDVVTSTIVPRLCVLVEAATGAGPSVDQGLLRDFVLDAQEQLDVMDTAFGVLSSDAANKESIDAVFRGFHTLKSASAIVGYKPFEAFAHKVENVLEEVRSGRTQFDGVTAKICTDACELVRWQIDSTKNGSWSLNEFETRVKGVFAQNAKEPQGEVDGANGGAGGNKNGTVIREPIKVDADKLDRLIDAIGELVISETMVSQSADLESIPAGAVIFKQIDILSKITRNLQEIGMALRMVPIRQTFQKMNRIVRDISKKVDKKVEFEVFGSETELDKTVVDKIGDPLVHMVRNAVDHGLEKTAEERVNAGKNPIGRVELRAFYKGGNVCIEISDDGRGLDPAKLIKKATEKGLIKPGQTLTDKEAFDLIFAPGFSTAEKVTDVSGRGVGMDVVRRNIEELHGHVEIESALGIGTLFRIRIPNTLAIIEGMVVLCGAERYVFPTQSIVRAVRPTESQIIPGKGVKQRMIDLGDEILPLYKLADLYGVNDSIDNPVDAIVLVLDNNGKHTCLLVDRIIKQQQFVSKTLGDMFKGVPGVSGGTIMSDGQVGLLVDVGLLMQSFSSKLRNIKEENS